MVELIELIHLLVSSSLVVLIWIMQLLHYPSFRFYASGEFRDGMVFHQREITKIVAPLMMIELASLFFLVTTDRPYIIPALFVLGIWACTITMQIPLHQILTQGKELPHINRLQKTNWIRTHLWTFKFLITFAMYLRNHSSLVGEMM